jgi:hypothetical protein
MKQLINDLVRDGILPVKVQDKMYQTEAGVLVIGLEAMEYARSHDATMHSVYPEKVYVGNVYEYAAEKCGYKLPYAHSDVIIEGAIELLKRIALKEVLGESR